MKQTSNSSSEWLVVTCLLILVLIGAFWYVNLPPFRDSISWDTRWSIGIYDNSADATYIGASNVLAAKIIFIGLITSAVLICIGLMARPRG